MKTSLLDDFDERDQNHDLVVFEALLSGDHDNQFHRHILRHQILSIQGLVEDVSKFFGFGEGFFDDIHIVADLPQATPTFCKACMRPASVTAFSNNSLHS